MPSASSQSNEWRWIPIRSGRGRTSGILENDTRERAGTTTSGKKDPSYRVTQRHGCAGDGTPTSQYRDEGAQWQAQPYKPTGTAPTAGPRLKGGSCYPIERGL